MASFIRNSVVLLCSGAMSIVSAARGAVIYGSVNEQILSIDVDTHEVAQIFQMPATVQAFNISAGPDAGALYVLGNTLPYGTHHLHRYDLATSTLTHIGASPVAVALGEGRDGYLYFGGATFGRIDPSTGQPTILNPSLRFSGDIATGFSGITLGILSRSGPTGPTSVLAQLNRQTGEAVDIGQMPVVMYGLAYTLDGRLWSSDTAGRIYQVNPNTAECSLAFATGYDLLDLASEPVPAPGCWWAFAGCALGACRRHRRGPVHAAL
jgi:hypothetical protein